MFEAIELGRKVSKDDFATAEPDLRTAILEAQYALRESQTPLVIVIAGVEGAGKGEVVNRLHKWLDTRWVTTHAFWDATDEETERPRFWRFWRCLPPAGATAIMFGSWYTQPVVDHVFHQIDHSDFEHELRHIKAFENLLADGGTRIIKFWFHLDEKTQKKRLRDDVKSGRLSSPLLKKYTKHYEDFIEVCERAVRMTDTGNNPWHLVEAADKRYRDLTVGQTLLHVLRENVAETSSKDLPEVLTSTENIQTVGKTITVLDTVDLTSKLTKENYEEELSRYQRKLNKLAWQAWKCRRHTLSVFEGWDAAGKGGAIRRVTQAIDARLYQAISVAAPTDEEKAHHYLWRFWRHLPRAGYMTFYDRSWYGRVLVERVEKFATQSEWQRAFQEINDFEEQLTEHGVILFKFWMHISADEQLRRFNERENLPWKRHKITDEDWRNRDKWNAYVEAVDEMVTRTSTEYAPWTLIPGNDKRFARIEVLKTMCQRLKQEL